MSTGNKTVAAILIALSLLVPCCGRERKTESSAASPAPSAAPRANSRERYAFAVVDYHHEGRLYATYDRPFENCTMPGDYMILRRTDDAAEGVPVVGLRVVREATNDPRPVTESSFIATANGRIIPPKIRRIAPPEPGFWEVVWSLDPDAEEVRIDQDIIATFQLDIRYDKLDWSAVPRSFRALPKDAKPNSEICFP